MWFTDFSKNNLVTLVLRDDGLTISWIQNRDKRPVLMLYKKINFGYADVVGGVFYNGQDIAREIELCLRSYGLTRAALAVCVEGEGVYQEFIKTRDTETIVHSGNALLKTCIWQNFYLCPTTDHDGFWHYVCGIKREFLFPYTLLGLAIGRPITVLTTVTAALLSLYRYRPDVVFRQSELSLCFERCAGDIAALFPAEVLARYVNISDNFLPLVNQEPMMLGASLGIFFARVNNSEHH